MDHVFALMEQVLSIIYHGSSSYAVFFIVVMVVSALYLHHSIKGDNPIEFWHFYSTKTPDGHQWGDPNKLGVLVGIFASTFIVGWVFYNYKPDNWYMIILFGMWLTFVAGVEFFAKWFRSFLDAKVKSQDLPPPPVPGTTVATATVTTTPGGPTGPTTPAAPAVTASVGTTAPEAPIGQVG